VVLSDVVIPGLDGSFTKHIRSCTRSEIKTRRFFLSPAQPFLNENRRFFISSSTAFLKIEPEVLHFIKHILSQMRPSGSLRGLTYTDPKDL
jgi:hypothetical protein